MKERFEKFTLLISKINRSIKRIENQEMAEYGLRSPHISCLYYLYFTEGMTATELCDRCEEDKATVSRSLDYLEAEGYLVRESVAAKRYKSPLFLTDKGREVGEKLAQKVDRVLAEIGRALTDEERVTFYRCLATISDRLEQCAAAPNSKI